MKLTGKQIQELHSALLDAFDRPALEMMLRIQLDRNLSAITAPGRLETVVFDLIGVAEREGWTGDLVRESHDWNPGNELLTAFYRSLQGSVPPSPADDKDGGPAVTPVPYIDPDNPPIAAIRRLLTGGFTDETLRTFCKDSKTFPPVLKRVGSGASVEEIASELIIYCETMLLWDELLVEVKEANPAWYKRFLTWL